VQKNIGVLERALKIGVALKNVGVRVCALNFGTARKNVGVWVCALNLVLSGAHTHNNGMRGVRSIGRVQRSWLVRVQCGYMLSRDSLVNGERRVLVRGGGVLNSGMVQHVE
jgi:hypothetical protein